MNKNIYVTFACLLLLVSCNNSKDPIITTVKNQIQVKVYNTKTWSLLTNKMDTVVGASVYLHYDSITLFALTDSKGIATFSNVKEKPCSIISSKDDLTNLINKDTLNNIVIGNLIVGVYKSQEDINSSADNSNAVIGGPKLFDMNGDGIVRINDKVHGQAVNFKYKYKDINDDGMIDVFDIVNGNLIKLDNVVTVSVYIGK